MQPLDEKGRAVQLMRSWFVGQPGEQVSCVGCHEPQNDAPPNVYTAAMRRRPSRIEPWRGPARPFGFDLEVQPVLGRHCVGCHNGQARTDGRKLPNLADRAITTPLMNKKGKRGRARFSRSYGALQPYVRRPGPEGDYHLLPPMEYHASTSELVQMLEKGHHNVQLDRDAWETLQTWIDLNAPYVAHWGPPKFRDQDQRKRRCELAQCYAGVAIDPEAEYETAVAQVKAAGDIAFVKPAPASPSPDETPQVEGWPFAASEAKQRQAAAGPETQRTLALGKDVKMDLVLIPAGAFVMGDGDEAQHGAVTIDKPFWMSVCEVTNAQFAQFDPAHDSRYIDRGGKDHNVRGFPANRPEQPVIRVTWQRATAFCDWLSKQTGKRVTLPTEAQWEWACRAGTATPMSYGAADADFSRYGNMADRSAARLRTTPFPTIGSRNDGQSYALGTGQFQANAWGLKDMHGNVAEWTRSTCRPGDGRKVVRGGSWRDRPQRCRSAFRLAYQAYQPVVNVGFRVVIEEPVQSLASAR